MPRGEPFKRFASCGTARRKTISQPAANKNEERCIRIRGAREHTLKNLDLDIPRERFVVITGLSGSGKSSLAFDTIYAEGQRRYVESLSTYARQFLAKIDKPDVDLVRGLPPTIALEQRQPSSNPRSNVATSTEIHDHLRLLFARAGRALCPGCGSALVLKTRDALIDELLTLKPGKRVMVLATLWTPRDGDPRTAIERARKAGFVRIRVDGEITTLDASSRAVSAQTPRRIDVVVDRLTIKPDIRSRLAESLETALELGGGSAIAAIETPRVGSSGRIRRGFEDRVLSDRFGCARCRTPFPELHPRLFSFNTPEGACPACNGLGTRAEFDPDLVIFDRDLSLAAGAVAPWRRRGKKLSKQNARLLRDFSEHFGVDPDVPLRNLEKELVRILLWGTSPEDIERYEHFFEGVIPALERRFEKTESEQVKSWLRGFMSERPCAVCRGTRLRSEALAVRLGCDATGERNIAQVCAMSIEQACAWFESLQLQGEAAEIARPLLKTIRDRLRFLVRTGVGYLTLDRRTATLSGGELQRIRLATQIGSGLAGICYVLDEPTIGLHQRDTARLLETLIELRDAGNTVIVVEHDEQTIRAADHLIDMGPGAGAAGGFVVAQGQVDEVLRCRRSLTASYLNGELDVPIRLPRRRLSKRALTVHGARENNLQNITCRFPLGALICVTGVSGSGKSTLVREVLYRSLARRFQHTTPPPGAHDRISGAEWIDRVVEVDQNPIGRSPRSSPATFTGVFAAIRTLFASLNEARIRGYGPSRFSFNVKGGRCEACQGQGTKRIEMHFLPDVHVRCERCLGTRYAREILEIRFRGLNIAEVLALTVEEAKRLFKRFDNIARPLKTLEEVGLGYLKLGQSSTTLSGGEAQRLKLAAELSRKTHGHTLYLLDEPTTGLHFADVSRLLGVLHGLADRGHTLVVIEHNLDVIKNADWVIDLGPEGGAGGGRVVCEGPPETIAACPRSHTGRYLREALNRAASETRRPKSNSNP